MNDFINIDFNVLPTVEWWILWTSPKCFTKHGIIVNKEKLDWPEVLKRYKKNKGQIVNRTKASNGSHSQWPLNVALFVPLLTSSSLSAFWKPKVYTYIEKQKAAKTFTHNEVAKLVWSLEANRDIELTYTDYR